MGCSYCGGPIEKKSEMCFMHRYDSNAEDLTKEIYRGQGWAFHKDCLDKQEERFKIFEGHEDRPDWVKELKDDDMMIVATVKVNK